MSLSLDRDVFNEKPSKEELVSATEDSSSARVAASAIIHTTMGDIQVGCREIWRSRGEIFRCCLNSGLCSNLPLAKLPSLFLSQMRLFYKECPKTVENFVVHSREGYYNGHLFHRVIKGFMVQTGDPTGNKADDVLAIAFRS